MQNDPTQRTNRGDLAVDEIQLADDGSGFPYAPDPPAQMTPTGWRAEAIERCARGSVLPCVVDTMSDKQRTAYRVTGPYRYSGDAHECFRIDGPWGIVASVYAYDDCSMAEQRALVMAEALEAAYAEST